MAEPETGTSLTFYDDIKAHCEDGLRRDKGSRMLYGCGNFTLVNEVILRAWHEIRENPIARNGGSAKLDEIVAQTVHEYTIRGFSYADACAVIAEAGETRLHEDHINSFEQSHYAAVSRYRWTHEARGVKIVIFHMAKTILLMEAYSFFAERLLDENGDWK